MTRKPLYFFFASVVAVMSGCAHWSYPDIPGDWHSQEIKDQAELNDTSKPRLQIIITSADFICNHTAMRLITPNKPVIFWDPGGGFGDSDESTAYFSDKGIDGLPLKIERHFDIVKTLSDDLNRYIDYRWQASSDELIEIFEFNLAIERAERLNQEFKGGENNDHLPGKFSTDAVPLMCSVAVSDFLIQFMADRILLPTSYFLPHNLSHQLYTQNPDRVLILRRNQPPLAYTATGQ